MIEDPDLSLHAFLFIKRNLIFPNQKLIVGHSYRGGSSLITRVLFNSFGLNKFVKKSRLTPRRFRDVVYNHRLHKALSETRFQSFLQDPSFTRVKFTRCPYRRAVSSYLYIMGKEQQITGNITGLLKADFPSRKPEENIHLSFYEFLRLLGTLDLEVYSSNNHYSQQFLYGEKEIFHYDFYYRLEDFEQAIQDLNQKRNLQIKMELSSEQSKLQRHHLKFRDDIDECVAEWPFQELHKPSDQQALFPHYRFFYNEKTRAMVERLYAKDLQHYRYSFTPDSW